MISALICLVNLPAIGMARDMAGRKSPLKLPVATTGNTLNTMQNRYIIRTEIRKFGRAFPMKERSFTI